MKMKNFLMVLVVLVITVNANAQEPEIRGYIGFTGGAGPNGANVGVDLGGSWKKTLIGMGIGGIFNSEGDKPEGTLDYPCPHGGYVKHGTNKSGETAVHFKVGPQLGRQPVYLFALAGLSMAEETEIVRSTATGWYYEQSTKTKNYGYGGGGIGYFPTNSRYSIQLEADNRRGFVFGMGWRF